MSTKNKNKKRNNITLKTRGSFNSFISSDDNTEYDGKKKGIYVKLEKDDNGNPYAWLIGGDTFLDSTFEELKKGAKGGRYKKFIAELLKMDPRFNSFTRPNVGKGIKISHAMFCKLFAPNSTLGRMYPKLVAKMNKRKYCHPTVPVPYAKPMHPADPAIRPADPALRPAPADPAPAAAALRPAPAAAALRPAPADPALRPAAAALRPAPPAAALRPAPPAAALRPADPHISDELRDPNPSASIPYAKPASVSIPYDNPFSIPAIHVNAHEHRFPKSFYHNKSHKSSVKMRQQNTRRMSALQNNLIKLTEEMGFNPLKTKNALIKHGNDIHRAIDELTTESLHTVTRDERSTHPRFETTVQIFNLTPRIKFTIKDNSGGGDCLFHSLYETLTRVNPAFTRGKTQHDIRLEIVNFVMNNLDEYQNQMTRQTFADALQHGVRVNGRMLYKYNYEREMKKRGTYGTELEISAASLLYGINIYVVNIKGISFDQLYIGDSPPTPYNTWYIFNYNNAHYTSLIPY